MFVITEMQTKTQLELFALQFGKYIRINKDICLITCSLKLPK